MFLTLSLPDEGYPRNTHGLRLLRYERTKND